MIERQNLAIGLSMAILSIGMTARAAPAPQYDEAALRVALRSYLRDADSAKFTPMRFAADGVTLCGGVNATNAHGGYTGFSPVAFTYVTGKPPKVAVKIFDEPAYADVCPDWQPKDYLHAQ